MVVYAGDGKRGFGCGYAKRAVPRHGCGPAAQGGDFARRSRVGYWLVAGAVLAGIGALPASAQEGEASNTVVIQGQKMEVWPLDDLRRRGLDVPDIPREKNAAWVYLEAVNALKYPPEDLSDALYSAADGTWPEGQTGERLAAWLAENQTALDAARRASEMPDYYMPFFRSPGGPDMLQAALLPPLSAQRQITRMWAAEAAYLQSQGKADAAMDKLLAAQRMANQVGNGKTLIEGLVGIGIAGQANHGMLRIAESGQVDAPTLRYALAELDRLSASYPSFERMIRAEEKYALSAIDDIIDVPGGFGIFALDFGSEPGSWMVRPAPKTGWARLKKRLNRLYLPDRAMKANVTKHYNAVAEAAKREEAGLPGPPLEEDKLFQQIPAWDGISRIMVPTLARVHENTLLSRSNSMRARMKLAVEAYKLERGEYPPTLTALVPEYVRMVPVDPMTGYDFEYRPKDGEKPGVAGLERVTRENVPDLVKKRRTPAILSPRAAKWRRCVESLCEKYEFTEKQRGSADAVLREMEARAGRYEQAQGEKLAKLVEEGESPELSKRMGPLDQMFDELQKRVEALATSEQRRAVRQKDKGGPKERQP